MNFILSYMLAYFTLFTLFIYLFVNYLTLKKNQASRFIAPSIEGSSPRFRRQSLPPCIKIRELDLIFSSEHLTPQELKTLMFCGDSFVNLLSKLFSKPLSSADRKEMLQVLKDSSLHGLLWAAFFANSLRFFYIPILYGFGFFLSYESFVLILKIFLSVF